jgi:hypothetical protein
MVDISDRAPCGMLGCNDRSDHIHAPNAANACWGYQQFRAGTPTRAEVTESNFRSACREWAFEKSRADRLEAALRAAYGSAT